VHSALEREAARVGGELSVWADAALLVLSDSKSGSPEAREAVAKVIENGWTEPKRQEQLLRAVALAEHRGSKDKVIAALESDQSEVQEAAKVAAKVLRLDRERKSNAKTEPMISDLKVEEVLGKVVETKGDRKVGQELFTRQTCVNCHTVSADEPLRGPFLGNIARTYKRRELAEAILVPNKSVAQGFVANSFVLKDGTELDGFVVQEAADKVVVRTIAAQEVSIATAEIEQRKKSERSLMPEGLAANLSVKELASLLDYLEALAAEQN
jgi:putative heme-binding domain-containing protein